MTGVPVGPARRLVVSAFADMLSLALLVTMGAVFFTQAVKIPLTTYGVGMTFAGLLGLAASIALGRLSDTIGHRRMLVVATALQAIAVLSYTLVQSPAPFVIAVS